MRRESAAPRRRRLALALAWAALAAAALAAASAAHAASGLAGLLAPPSVCPHQSSLGDPLAVQERAMHCMTDFARERRGLAPLRDVPALDRAGRRKSLDIVRCDDFSHEACGREFTYWMEHFGYLGRGCASAGENIAWGTGSLGSVRSIFGSWIRSPGHRRNILSASFQDLGVGLRVGRLEGYAGAHVWTQEFGGRC